MLLPLHTRTSPPTGCIQHGTSPGHGHVPNTTYKQFVLKTQYLGVVLYFLQKKHVI